MLRRIIALQQRTFDRATGMSDTDVHLSEMHYRRTCSKETHTAIQLIEPLIGLIRDPLTICPRLAGVPSDLEIAGEYAIQSKRHLLLGPSSPYRIQPPISSTMPPLSPWLYRQGARKILVDIGSSYFKSRNGNTAEIGTCWFYDYFSNRSITFDRIIAFEYQPLVVRRVWEELPEDVFPIYTFINVGVEATLKNRFNPWQMIENVAQVDDYVIVKLDIDKPVLESALMKQLVNESSRARRLIDEMFFEKHVSEDRNSKEDKLKDSYELFTQLRQAGMRAHGWPWKKAILNKGQFAYRWLILKPTISAFRSTCEADWPCRSRCRKPGRGLCHSNEPWNVRFISSFGLSLISMQSTCVTLFQWIEKKKPETKEKEKNDRLILIRKSKGLFSFAFDVTFPVLRHDR